MKKSILLGLMVSLFAMNASAIREWDMLNDPQRMFDSYENNFQILESSGSISGKLWSDTYWPSQEGGAAWRWQFGKAAVSGGVATNPYSYQLYSGKQLAKMSDAQINQLSPAEKFDIVTGRYDYPTVMREKRRAQPTAQKWFGLCHAVAAVTALYQEPQTQQVETEIGNRTRLVTFYASDIKALLALSVDQTSAHYGSYLGMRCDTANSNYAECWDTNPASFYIAMTNMVGALKKTIIMDIDRGPEVWNSVVQSYSSVLTRRAQISENASPQTVREVRVDMTVKHTIGVAPNKQAVGPSFKSTLYSFTLELDEDDNIVGGEWLSKERPDMLWMANSRMPVDPNLTFIYELVQAR